MSGPLLVLFDAAGHLRTTSAEIAALTGLDARHFTPGQTIETLRPLLVAARPDWHPTVVDLADGGICLSLNPPDQAQAAQAAQAKSRFLATMSHELRTPLNVVIGFADTLARDTSLPAAQVAEFAAAIHQAGQDLLGLVNTLLDVARIEQRRFALQADTIDIAHLLNTSLTAAQDQARRARIILSAEIRTGSWNLSGDERRLRQVLGQLLSNAITFSREGGRVAVTAGLSAAGELALRVSDTGIGIAPDRIAQLFEPFSQGDGSLSRRNSGMGLGLYVSRALVEAHGGTLTLESVPGTGTTATIILPRTRLIEPSASAALLQETP